MAISLLKKKKKPLMAVLLCSATLVGQPGEGEYASLLPSCPPCNTDCPNIAHGHGAVSTQDMAHETCDICSKDLLEAVPLDLFSSGPLRDTYS